MSQIKIFGIKEQLQPVRNRLSDTIHQCIVDVLHLPIGKRAHRFFYLEKEDFFFPEDRTEQYTIIEITMIAGRKTETKKRLIQELFYRIEAEVGIRKMDLEICIYEPPACNWGFRGMNGDEIQLDYTIGV
ncbi:tautomerase family protein [Cytophagaceae bacterium YF14B1]|uniref:Tautomerase family protein n=1 Tax=Xanthocytophaga flava TaxID=3048013 RepID=A0AAE3QTZ4_9BACT|nr:tautomerase family protein [Xanthocytophaga flavus]MDJ1483206.1 tautomerase family protein [Xanthocytophaga flavus]